MTGVGRTGEWFGCDLLDVAPDIMTMATGLTGAYQPLGATIVTSGIAEYFEDEIDGAVGDSTPRSRRRMRR